ncbi:MAG: hypothetical protein EHM49_00360 [Deltaproteobacteria bacterium]|nr:MAG: hypothetical protein EHM49_00360 [Deltaproteobacteria bacterium]
MALYLVVIHGDVDPGLEGPFNSEDERDKRALEFREEYGDSSGVYMLDVNYPGPILQNAVEISAYTGGFFEP